MFILPGLLLCITSIIKQTDLLSTTPPRSLSIPPLPRPNQTELKPKPQVAKPPPCCVAQLKMLGSVCVCVSFCCSVLRSAYLTAVLPLTVSYLSLPLRKLLLYLWLLCNSTCMRECLCVCLWMQGFGKFSTHLADYFLFYRNLS